VLTLAAEKAGWGQPLPHGRARGIAAHYTFGSYAAEVAEVSVDAQRRIRVHRVVAAIDVGLPVNPLNLVAQTEGGIIDGLGAAMFGEITIARGRTVQSTFEGFRLLRNRDAPEVDVHIVPSTEHPTGFGEIALPPIAPAVGERDLCGDRNPREASAVGGERIPDGQVGLVGQVGSCSARPVVFSRRVAGLRRLTTKDHEVAKDMTKTILEKRIFVVR
jgi:hypothetical protein